MTELNYDKQTKAIVRLVEDLFDVGVIYNQQTHLIISLVPRYDTKQSVKILKDRLKLAGYEYQFDKQEYQILLTINPHPHFKIPALNIILFIITLFSMYVVPVFLKQAATNFSEAYHNTIKALSHGAGIEFTLALISILFVHEMGHFITSRRHNIITSWPYFIPAPNIIGTFGAIIKSKSPFWNRSNLIEVGAAGPIAGWVVAVFWLWFGLSRSTFLPPGAFPPGEMGFSLAGESILMKLSTLSIVGTAPAGYFYRLSEAAFAGWVGLLVTALNMLPIGQLDGGHVLYGLSRRKQHILGLIAMGILFILGFQSPIWWFFAIFGLVFGVKHPPTINDNKKPNKVATLMGIASIIILIISFTPVPFR